VAVTSENRRRFAVEADEDGVDAVGGVGAEVGGRADVSTGVDDAGDDGLVDERHTLGASGNLHGAG